MSVGDFVALTNQALEHVFPNVLIVGELANFRVSKNRWVYFDLKDDVASVRFFGTVYMLPGPLEEGMMLEVRGTPRLHPAFGFSVTVQSLRPVGAGAIRKAADLLQAKLAAEGLFDDSRKRSLPYPPQRVGLITSGESAAYADFVKIASTRWPALAIELADIQVQGEPAPGQIVAALQWFNEQAAPPDVLIVIRGGGSADDLHAFSNEQVVRAVAASRVPTLVAIGHEIDNSLAELAADQRASTPSNAAELLVPDRREMLQQLAVLRQRLAEQVEMVYGAASQRLESLVNDLDRGIELLLDRQRLMLHSRRQLAMALDPALALRRGFAIIRDGQGKAVRSGRQLAAGGTVDIIIPDALIRARIEQVEMKKI